MPSHEALQSGLVRPPDDLGADLVGGTILRPNHSGLADGPAAGSFVRELAALRVAHLLAPASEVGLVDLDRADEAPRLVIHPHFAEPVQHEPCGLLSDLEIPVQLHRRDTLEVGGLEVDGEDPLAKRDLRAFERGTSPDGEIGAEIGAPIG